jgi:hypothetical protein
MDALVNGELRAVVVGSITAVVESDFLADNVIETPDRARMLFGNAAATCTTPDTSGSRVGIRLARLRSDRANPVPSLFRDRHHPSTRAFESFKAMDSGSGLRKRRGYPRPAPLRVTTSRLFQSAHRMFNR